MTKINMSGSHVGAKALCAVIDPTTLEALPLLATDNGDGTAKLKIDASVAVDSIDIGDVDILEFPAGNLGQQQTNYSLSVAPAINITDATYIGDIKFGESLPAGTNLVGKVGIDQDTANANEVVAGYKTKRLSVTFTGTGATGQYDAVGTLTEVANWAAANGRGATLRRAWIEVNNNAIAPQFELHFFNASNPTVAADNVTWTSLAADAAKRAGYLIMPACAKPAGSGTIDIVRAQSDDYGLSLDMQMTCAAASTSLWLALKLLTSGISFAAAPGNTITVIMEIEQS